MLDYTLFVPKPDMQDSARYMTTNKMYSQPSYSSGSSEWQTGEQYVHDQSLLYDGVNGLTADSFIDWRLTSDGLNKPQVTNSSNSMSVQPMAHNISIKNEFNFSPDPYLLSYAPANVDMMLTDDALCSMPSPSSSFSTPLGSPQGDWTISTQYSPNTAVYPNIMHPSPVRPRSLPQLDSPGSQFLLKTPENNSKVLHTSISPANTVPEKPRKRRRINRAPSSFSGTTFMKSAAPGVSEQHNSGSFGVFVVETAPLPNEPLGGTYMSTVNLQSMDAAPSFDHGPTDLPPRPYVGGPDAVNLWKPRKDLGTIPGSAMEYLPALEARLYRLERAVDSYVELRGQQALRNSILPEELIGQ